MEKKMMIEGMTCMHCSKRVESALNSIEGVKAKVDLEDKSAFLKLKKPVEDKILSDAVTNAGYKVVSIKEID
jgi:copper chaperone CopZ